MTGAMHKPAGRRGRYCMHADQRFHPVRLEPVLVFGSGASGGGKGGAMLAFLSWNCLLRVPPSEGSIHKVTSRTQYSAHTYVCGIPAGTCGRLSQPKETTPLLDVPPVRAGGEFGSMFLDGSPAAWAGRGLVVVIGTGAAV